MSKSNVIQGKALEYAVLEAFQSYLKNNGVDVVVDISPAYETAHNAYLELSNKQRSDYAKAANESVDIIVPFEPMLLRKSDTLTLKIQTDSAGQSGDVRDVICTRDDANWEIGFSCKHNHEALKHPRVTLDADFGKDWIGIPCSKLFLSRTSKALEPVKVWAEQNTNWNQHENKQELVYQPIVDAYIDELDNLCANNPDAPRKLLEYFFGNKDFYKIIADDNSSSGDCGSVKVVAFNIAGTLGKSNKRERPIHPVKKVKMPTRLIEVIHKEGTLSTLLLTFDENWTVSMRLHSADSKVKLTGLKWDIQLLGMPSDMYQQERPFEVVVTSTVTI